MDSKMYVENIDEVLKMCWKPKDNVTTNNSTSINIKNINNVNKPSFAMKSFQTMYNQFLYKKSLRQKTVEKKLDDIQLIKTFEDLDKLTQTNKEIEDNE